MSDKNLPERGGADRPAMPGRDRRGLGRGLSALMADTALDAPADAPRSPDRMLPIARIRPNLSQPRRNFADQAMDDLTDSIRAKGVIQPLIVRPDPNFPGDYQIVAGERRWRAAQRARLHELPVIIRELDDTETLEVALIENIQRADLNAIEEAVAFAKLIERFGHTQDKLATALGKSRSHIANTLRLLNLPEELREMVRDGRLSAGHARALLTSDDPAGLAAQVLEKGLSVRQTEALARKDAEVPAPTTPRSRAPSGQKDADTRALEQDVSAATGLMVSISFDAISGKGSILIGYEDLGTLDRICEVLSDPASGLGRHRR